MNIEKYYLTNIPEAQIVIEVFKSEPQNRIKIINRYLHKHSDPVEAMLITNYAIAAIQATIFMNGRPPIEWLNSSENGYQMLERITGYRP